MDDLSKCRQRRSLTFCAPMLVLLLLIGSPRVEAFSRAAVVAAAPVVPALPAPVVAPVAAPPKVAVVPPEAAPAPVVAIPPKAAVAPVVAKPPAVVAPVAAPVVAKPPAVVPPAVAPVVAKPPAVAAPVVAPVAANAPTAAPEADTAPVVAPIAAPVAAPVATPANAPATAKAPAKPPTATGPALAPTPAAALAPSTGIPLDAAQVKALNALGILATAEACSTIPLTVMKCDANATTQHLVSLNAQDCPSTATITDASLAALSPFLTDLSFMNCALKAPLPAPTDRMASTLESLTVTGAPVMPGWWIGRLTSLKIVHIQDTYVNASSLGVVTSKLASLTELTIANASMTGAIPTVWPAAATLTTLDLSGNQLSGPLPVAITKLPALETLDLSRNRLNDHIITAIGNLGMLQTLSLSNNQLRMAIPTSLGNLHYLTKLDLSSNKLNGTVPAELVNLPLTYLDLSNNSLSGAIPFDDLFLSKLTTFRVSGNAGLCYNSTVTSAKAAVGLKACGAMEPALAPEYYGPAMAPEEATSGGGNPPAGKKKLNVVAIVFGSLGALAAVAVLAFCCCRYWGAKAGYE